MHDATIGMDNRNLPLSQIMVQNLKGSDVGIYNTIIRTTKFAYFAHCLVFKITNGTSRKLNLFATSSEGKEAPNLLGPLERANLNHWTSHTST
jgi:hypothetical protein